jgi:hypothetical protein
VAHAGSAGGGNDPTHVQLISGSELTPFTATTTTGASERRNGAWDSYVAQFSHSWGSVKLRTGCGGEGASLARIGLSCKIGGLPGRLC